MSDDVCVITGGGSGIGRATAALMGERGYRIVLAGRTPAKLADTVADLRNDGVAAEAVAGDVSGHQMFSTFTTPEAGDYTISCTSSSAGSGMLARLARNSTASGNDRPSISMMKLRTPPPFLQPKQ